MHTIIPNPNGTIHMRSGRVTLPEQIAVDYGVFRNWCTQAFLERTAWEESKIGFPVQLQRVNDMPVEGYRLQVQMDRILVQASTETGVVWALASLWQMLDGARSLPLCDIQDQPKYEHRGLNLDCARHFFSVETVKKVIDQLSLVKMNVLHWHLADDQSWRIESLRFPKLQETSGQYYTQEQIREVVEYARVRGVEVVPEIDLPGHTTGILAAYPELGCFGKEVELATCGGIYPIILCAGKEPVFEFLEQLFEEICPLFPSDRFHVGGDEAPKSEWKQCPDCQRRMQELGLEGEENLQGYFTQRLADMLAKHGKRILCWNDSLLADNLPEGTEIQYWTLQHLESMEKYHKASGKFIYSDMFELYLDYPHSMSPLKRVYHSKPHIHKTDCAYAPNVRGMEACMWTEHVAEPGLLYQRLFPRVYALAEAAWSQKRNYEEFKKRLVLLLLKAEKAGVTGTQAHWWDPQGKARREEALNYMSKMFSAMSAEAQESTTEGLSINMAFLMGFLTKFFKVTDLPFVAKALKR